MYIYIYIYTYIYVYRERGFVNWRYLPRGLRLEEFFLQIEVLKLPVRPVYNHIEIEVLKLYREIEVKVLKL